MTCAPMAQVVEPLVLGQSRYLVLRPEKGRSQPYLRRRNMTVGQLVYTMRANNLTPQEAAEDFGLLLEEVLEAQAYFQANGDLIASEIAQESHWLRRQGVKLDPVPD